MKLIHTARIRVGETDGGAGWVVRNEEREEPRFRVSIGMGSGGSGGGGTGRSRSLAG